MQSLTNQPLLEATILEAHQRQNKSRESNTNILRSTPLSHVLHPRFGILIRAPLAPRSSLLCAVSDDPGMAPLCANDALSFAPRCIASQISENRPSGIVSFGAFITLVFFCCYSPLFALSIFCYNLDTSHPPRLRDPARPFLSPAQARLSFGSGLLTLFTRRSAVVTHLTRTRQLLTRGSKGVPLQAIGPESVTTPFPTSLPSSLPSSLLSLRSLSHLSSKTFLSRSHSMYYIRTCRMLHTMSTERAKGCWRGLNLDEQIEAALRDGLSGRRE